MSRGSVPVLLAFGVIACGGSGPPPPAGSAPAEEPPVAVNAEPAVQYPPDLYDRRVEGDVVLRLFVDSSGHLSPESTRVSESSGFAALDSAAVRGTSRLRYAPARRHGLPVATAFLQTVEFRRVGGSATAAPPAAPPTTPNVARPPRDTVRPRPAAQPDSVRARRDTSVHKPDSTPPLPPPDSTKARPDTNASAS
ncbi:MAG TPA: energy transducer TonB [Gemmatimonadales bacterium]|nr:energy transducer TonB [Gemmatimonadales bacterium]